MKYFTDNFERRGTCYHEFTRGKWDGKTYWSDESLYLRDDYMSDLKLYELVFKPAFAEHGKNFSRWGGNEVDRELWDSMLSRAMDVGGEVWELFAEITDWIEKSLSGDETFAILGI